MKYSFSTKLIIWRVFLDYDSIIESYILFSNIQLAFDEGLYSLLPSVAHRR